MVLLLFAGFLISAGIAISILLQTTQNEETIAGAQSRALRIVTVQEESFILEKEIPAPVIRDVPVDDPQTQLVRVAKPLHIQAGSAQE